MANLLQIGLMTMENLIAQAMTSDLNTYTKNLCRHAQDYGSPWVEQIGP